jgi:hypothetical protein
MQEVPTWWVVISCIYFGVSIVWSVVLVVGMVKLYQKVMPVLTEARVQVKRVSNQAKGVALKASNTANIVHVHTQNLIGNANSTGFQVTSKARSVGAALTGLLVAARVMSFVRKVF